MARQDGPSAAAEAAAAPGTKPRGRPKGSGAVLTDAERKERRRANNRRAARRATAKKLEKQTKLERDNAGLREQLAEIKRIAQIHERLRRCGGDVSAVMEAVAAEDRTVVPEPAAAAPRARPAERPRTQSTPEQPAPERSPRMVARLRSVSVDEATGLPRSGSGEKRAFDAAAAGPPEPGAPRVDSATEKRNRVCADEFVGSVPLFARMSLAQRQQIAGALQPAKYLAGERIVRQGEPGDRFFLVTAGTVVITEDNPQAGRALTMQRGRFFGEIALVKECLRTANVTALTDVEALYLRRDKFLSLFRPANQEPVRDLLQTNEYSLPTAMSSLSLGSESESEPSPAARPAVAAALPVVAAAAAQPQGLLDRASYESGLGCVTAALAPAFAPPQPTRPPPAHGIPAAAPGGLVTATAAPVVAPAPQAAGGGAGAVADDPLAVGSSLQSLDSLGLDTTSSLLGTGIFADDLDDVDIPLLSPTSSAGAGAHSSAQEGPLSFGSLDLSMLPQMTV